MITEFGSTGKVTSASKDAGDDEGSDPTEDAEKDKSKEAPAGQGGDQFIEEERVTGAVEWATYKDYCKAIGSWWWIVLFLNLLILQQIAEVGNSLFLGFWSGETIPGFSTGQYMAVYAGEHAIASRHSYRISLCRLRLGRRGSSRGSPEPYVSSICSSYSVPDSTP